jgi:hypothetical protein
MQVRVNPDDQPEEYICDRVKICGLKKRIEMFNGQQRVRVIDLLDCDEIEIRG